MSDIQKRIYELDTYVQLAPGDAGYVSPTLMYLAVDRTGLSEPFKFPLSTLMDTHHIETASITPTTAIVSVTYDLAFNNSSYFFNELQVYKIDTISGDTYKHSVTIKNLVLTTSGFSFELNKYEAGLIVTYWASEPSITSSYSGFSMLSLYRDGDDVVTIAVSGVPVKYTGFLNAQADITTSDITYSDVTTRATINSDGTYNIKFLAGLLTSGTNDYKRAWIYKNGVALAQSGRTDALRIGNVIVERTVQLVATDYIEIYIENQGNTNNVTVEYPVLTIERKS